MENRWIKKTLPHPSLLESLFAYKAKTMVIFNDVLGLHNISHLAVTRIDNEGKILVFSSTPAMEYNLFSNSLWCFDNTYVPAWFTKTCVSNWEDLYQKTHFDLLYSERQIKHHLSLGLSLAIQEEDRYYIYSIAFSKAYVPDFKLLTGKIDDFKKIGQYCKNLLQPYFAAAEQ